MPTMSHPRVEEVSDSDPDAVSDPESADIDDFDETDILRQRSPAAPSPTNLNSNSNININTIPPSPAVDRSAYSSYQCLYPVYFDASRTRSEGRRVPSSLAVHNPLAREIANACSRLRLPTLLEPEKTHPRDWANPGRVKVGLKAVGKGSISNKHELYGLVARHLQENPTTEASPALRVRIGGEVQPPAGTAYPRPAVPRGWKMGELLPYLSAGMTGGGVSENLFKDMMREMQAGGDPMAALMRQEDKKRDKRKK